jgi:hypothetical protein
MIWLRPDQWLHLPLLVGSLFHPQHSRGAGGKTSNKLREVRESSREKPRINAMSPAGVSEIGQAMSGKREGNRVTAENPATQIHSGAGYPTTLGNVKALEGSGAGARPGGGNRTVYPRGTEAVHGSVAKGVPNTAPDVKATAPVQRGLSEKGRVG